MANEITFGYLPSKSLFAIVFKPNGDVRTARGAMTEHNEGLTSYYRKDDGGIQAEDFVMIDDTVRVVGQGQYQPESTAIGGGSSVASSNGYIGDVKLGETVYFMFSTGSTITDAGTPRIYRDDIETPITGGIAVDIDINSETNMVGVTIVLTTENGYLSDSDYTIVLSGATIGGETVTTTIGTFSIENRHYEPLQRYTAK